jgi:gluconokinase
MPFVDGDDLHPKSNIDKMASGQPLTDEDRKPWLELIRTTAVRMVTEQQKRTSEAHSTARVGVVVACSALKKTYRDHLRGRSTSYVTLLGDVVPSSLDMPTYFLFIKGEQDALMERMGNRQGHFMKASMLASQLQTLESPEGEEGVVVIPMNSTSEDQVRLAQEGLAKLLNGTS